MTNPSAFNGFGAPDGPLSASTAHVSQGNFALAFPVNANPPLDVVGVDVAVCPGGAVQLGGMTLRFNLFLSSLQQDLPTGGVNGNGIVIDQSGQRLSTGDFSLLDSPVSNVWHAISLPLPDGGFTRVGFQMIIGDQWTGTVFVDDVQVGP